MGCWLDLVILVTPLTGIHSPPSHRFHFQLSDDHRLINPPTALVRWLQNGITEYPKLGETHQDG